MWILCFHLAMCNNVQRAITCVSTPNMFSLRNIVFQLISIAAHIGCFVWQCNIGSCIFFHKFRLCWHTWCYYFLHIQYLACLYLSICYRWLLLWCIIVVRNQFVGEEAVKDVKAHSFFLCCKMCSTLIYFQKFLKMVARHFKWTMLLLHCLGQMSLTWRVREIWWFKISQKNLSLSQKSSWLVSMQHCWFYSSPCNFPSLSQLVPLCCWVLGGFSIYTG